MTENVIVKQLRKIATKLTGDPDLQKDLMQEMFLHLVRLQTAEPSQSLVRHLETCGSHARNFISPSLKIDSPRPGHDKIPSIREHHVNGALAFPPMASHVEIQGERITTETINLILPLLSEMQQQVLSLLMKGYGVRQAARELGVTHPAVIKHRKKIARIARELLPESEGIGVVVAIHDGKRNLQTG
jgi:hypothetical protein